VRRSHVGHSSTPSVRSSARLLMALLAMALAIPAAAKADALPDGRVYEQVSPTTKNGFEAGASGGATRSGVPLYATAMADGSGLFYGVSGPVGTVRRGLQFYAVGRRGADGWQSENPVPAGSLDRIFLVNYSQHNVLPSSDLSKVLWNSSNTYVPDNPSTLGQSAALYEGHPDGTIDWLSRPLINDPLPAPGQIPVISKIEPVGASPDFSTVYFWSQPTLLPQDAVRAGGQGWGLYEYDNGVLEPAGTLPDGSESPGGAAPASAATPSRDVFNLNTFENTSNQVSRDGSTLLFVSPDPGGDPSAGPTTQLYVRRGGHSTLISHDENHDVAPSGASPVQGLSQSALAQGFARQYGYGSPDGKTVIFQSLDSLTSGAPNDGLQKVYMYDVDTDTVHYLPDVAGAVVAGSEDNSRFLFSDATRIALWDHGTVKTIATVPSGLAQMSPARATASGSVFAFTTRAPIPGFNNGANVLQVYRYDVAASKLSCVSCPPDGITPRGDAHLSNDDILGNTFSPDGELVGTRGISDDGERVFFDTPDPLRPRDTNGLRDVYEWTPSGVSLISTGRSQRESFLIDSSANGNDVFFSTVEGLDPGDTDASYDVYDARVGGGFKRADVPSPCASDGCQGAPTRSPALSAPGSTSFVGNGNEQTPKSDSTSTARLKLGTRKVVKSSLEVRVTLTGPGRVTVVSTGLHSVTKSAAKAGTLTIAVPLTAAAKRILKSKHKLKLNIRVGFTPRVGAASSVTFVLNAKA
jgi:hypothetical protein